MTPKQKRTEIKRLLALLDEHNRVVFNKMYSHMNPERPVDEVVDLMPSKKLNWALQQCEASYHKIFQILKS